MDRCNHSLILFICALFSFIEIVHADTLSLAFDNDVFAGRDGGGYTNGIRVGWLSDELSGNDANGSQSIYASLMKNTVAAIPFSNLDEQKKHNVGMSIYQMMNTPSRIANSEPDYDDFPYSGYLRASFFLFEWDNERYDEYSFNIGIVGPISGAEKVQKISHKIMGDKDPKGWDNQLDNHLTAGIAYGQGRKNWTYHYDNGFDADWVNSFRIEFGNYYSGISGGTVWRFGKNYSENFTIYYPSYPAVTGDNALLSIPKRNNSLGWSLSAGLFADAAAYLYVIDAANDYHIDRNIYSGSAIGSGTLYFADVEISLSMRIYTALIKESTKRVSYGTVSLLWHY